MQNIIIIILVMAMLQKIQVLDLLKKKDFKQNYHDKICHYIHQGRQYLVSYAERQNAWAWGKSKCLLVYCKISEDDSFIGEVNFVKNSQHPFVDSQTEIINKNDISNIADFQSQTFFGIKRRLCINFLLPKQKTSQQYQFPQNQVIIEWVKHLKRFTEKYQKTIINLDMFSAEKYEDLQDKIQLKGKANEQKKKMKDIIKEHQKQLTSIGVVHSLEIERLTEQLEILKKRSKELQRRCEELTKNNEFLREQLIFKQDQSAMLLEEIALLNHKNMKFSIIPDERDQQRKSIIVYEEQMNTLNLRIDNINQSLKSVEDQRNSYEIELTKSKKLCSDQTSQLLTLRKILKDGGFDEIFNQLMESNNQLRQEISQLKIKLQRIAVNRKSSYLLPSQDAQSLRNTQKKAQNKTILLIQEDQYTFSTSPTKKLHESIML